MILSRAKASMQDFIIDNIPSEDELKRKPAALVLDSESFFFLRISCLDMGALVYADMGASLAASDRSRRPSNSVSFAYQREGTTHRSWPTPSPVRLFITQ